MYTAINKLRNIKLIIESGGEDLGYYIYEYHLDSNKCVGDYLCDDLSQAFYVAKDSYNIEKNEFVKSEDVILPSKTYKYEAKGKADNLDVLLTLELNTGKHHICVYNSVSSDFITEYFCSTLHEAFIITKNLYKVMQDDFILMKN